MCYANIMCTDVCVMHACIYDIHHALRYVYALIYYLGCANVDDGTHNLDRFSYCCTSIFLYWCVTTLFFIPILNLTYSRPRAQTLTIPYNQLSRPTSLAFPVPHLPTHPLCSSCRVPTWKFFFIILLVIKSIDLFSMNIQVRDDTTGDLLPAGYDFYVAQE